MKNTVIQKPEKVGIADFTEILRENKVITGFDPETKIYIAYHQGEGTIIFKPEYGETISNFVKKIIDEYAPQLVKWDYYLIEINGITIPVLPNSTLNDIKEIYAETVFNTLST